jgi:hypothetical protein
MNSILEIKAELQKMAPELSNYETFLDALEAKLN